MRKVSFTKEELEKEFPSLAKAYNELIESDPKKFYRRKVEYSGEYVHTDTRVPRRTTLGTIVETLQNEGYEVLITARKV